MRTRLVVAAAAAVVGLTGCAGPAPAEPSDVPSAAEQADADAEQDQQYPDIVAAELDPNEDGTFDVRVTVSSPYDTPMRYADGWRVLAPDGSELGSHTLLHDHAGEQPFTRVQTGLIVPAGVEQVTVEGRDIRNGYGGSTVIVMVPRS